MKPCECSLTCELCSEDAYYCDSVPSGEQGANHPGETGYMLQPLCWLHGAERKREALSRVSQVVRCVRQGLARLDRDRCSGEMECAECGCNYFRHPHDEDHPYLNVLCDGSAVKL